ncbi:hypothetical protein BY458DRAFT_429957 [Sporodiniella umbellata]|nr:hypothetical protein BY458DRAFT_429957 [Sporodiniella umbellata]
MTAGSNQESKKEPRLVLHTGFPPIEGVNGLPLIRGRAAAASFSVVSAEGESWWDRWFGRRHVHLVRVELPVRGDRIQLSVCPAETRRWGTTQGFPDLERCVASVALETSRQDPEDLFRVVEWEPTETVLLKKSVNHWLVVQSAQDNLDWVYAQTSPNRGQDTIAYQNEGSWQLQLKDQPIPSIMITIQDH